MADDKPRGFFFVVEGIDGCGKSTQTAMLTEFLKRLGRQVRTVQDPGTTQAGLKLRELLLNKEIALSPKGQLLCFTAARAELADVIREYLSHGIDVVSDRWFLSTLAYQGIMAGAESNELCQMVALHKQFVSLFPDVCLLLNVEAETAEARMRAAGRTMDRFEVKPLEWRQRLSGAYPQAAHVYASYATIAQLDGEIPAEAIHSNVLYQIAEHCHPFANLMARQHIFNTLRTA